MLIEVDNNRVVIDTNVLISALIGQYSFPYKILQELALTGEIVPCLSSVLMEEYLQVSQREKFQRFPAFSERASQLIGAIKEISFWIDPNIVIEEIADMPDNRILELAITADAFCIITGNTLHFNFNTYQSVQIFTPAEFWEYWQDNLPITDALH